MKKTIHYYQPNVPHIAKEKYGGFVARATNGKVALMLEVEGMVARIVQEESKKYNPQPLDTIPPAILQHFLQHELGETGEYGEYMEK